MLYKAINKTSGFFDAFGDYFILSNGLRGDFSDYFWRII